MQTRITMGWLAATFLIGMPLQGSASAQPKDGADWPVHRGNSLQTGVADATLPDRLVVRWTFNAQSAIEGAPIIYQNTVFVGAGTGKLYALELATGKKKWDYPSAGILGAPAARNGAVYFGDVKGLLHCVDAETGKKRWTVATDAEIAASPNFAGDKIIVGSNDHHLYCVTADGKIAWQCRTKEKIRGSPAIADGRVLLAGCDQSLHVIDAASGKPLAAIPLGGHVGASVAVHGDHLYVGHMANEFLAVNWKKGNILWRFEAKRNAQPFYSSAAVNEELVIAGGRDKLVRAWQRQSGKEVWTFATRGRVDSSPAIVGNRVVVGSLDGTLYVLDLARGKEQARFELGPISAAPAVARQAVVVATLTGDVVCLAGKM